MSVREEHPEPMVRTTDEPDDDASSPTHGRPGGRRRRVLAVVTVDLLAGVSAAGTAVAGPETVDGTPCSVGTRACVDLENDQAWLIRHGEIEYGPGYDEGPAHGVVCGAFVACVTRARPRRRGRGARWPCGP